MKQMLLFALLLMTAAVTTYGQTTFDYSFSQQTGTYSNLSNPSALFAGIQWDEEEASIDLGFSFPFMGSNFSSVSINTDGFLAFDDDYHYVAAGCYSDLLFQQYGDGTASIVSYATEGSAGSRIVKIEFRDCGVYEGSATDKVNFQIWLYEADGAIEYHYGNSTVASPEAAYEEESGPQVGLLNMTVHTAGVQSGLLLDAAAGNAATAATAGNALHHAGTPGSGIIYRFQPN